MAAAALLVAAVLAHPHAPDAIGSWLDRGHVVEAFPAARVADAGRFAVTLRYDDVGEFAASVDDTAIVETQDIDTLEKEHFVRRVELLMPAAGLWRVRGAPGETGV